jgi:hypothetical protein
VPLIGHGTIVRIFNLMFGWFETNLTMRYAAQLLGDAATIEKVAPCFQGGAARIRRFGNDWFLESSVFESCPGPAEVFPIAKEILTSVHQVSMLYAYLLTVEHIRLGYIQEFNDAGSLTRRSLHATQKVNVYSAEGLAELKGLRGHQSSGSAVVEGARSSRKVQEALSLIGCTELGWPQLYNILEFLGGDRAIVKRGWATQSEVRRYKQTANHFRHLGSLNRYPLPPNPPSVSDGRKFILLNLLKRWVSEQL